MTLNFEKGGGLIPVVVQDDQTAEVLMLGYMNEAAFAKTLTIGKVTFYSRSKKRLWTKGETSGHYLEVISLTADCDADTVLIQAKPHGPTCHKGTKSCFGEKDSAQGFLYELEQTVADRIDQNVETSYTNQLYQKGMHKMAQKVGEEAVELVIEAMSDQLDLFKNEAADLLYHFLILLKAKDLCLRDIENVLKSRTKVN